MRRLAPLLVALLLAGCLDQGGSPGTGGSPVLSPSPPATGGPVALREIEAGTQTGAQQTSHLVIADAAAWTRFWQEHNSNRIATEVETPPPVDFARETVVVALLGAKPNGCWAVRVENATAQPDGRVVVGVTTYTPPPETACIAVVSYPYHIVALETRSTRIEFEGREAQGPPEAAGG